MLILTCQPAMRLSDKNWIQAGRAGYIIAHMLHAMWDQVDGSVLL